MRVTKKTESLFEIEFDESEVQSLEDIEDVFEVIPEDVIQRSVTESVRLGTAGIHNLLDVVTNRRKKPDAPTNTESN